MQLRHGLARRLTWGGILALAVLASGAAAGGFPAAAARAAGGVANFALPATDTPDYVFPLLPVEYATDVNFCDLEYQLYRPLYWVGKSGGPDIDYELSVGQAPVYSNDDKTVTIHLNHFTWSDGHPVTNRDVEFWMDLLKAEKDNWYNYTPGAFPDNVVAMSFPAATPYTFSLTFNRSYNPVWITNNELTQIIPIPQHAWDRTSGDSPVGNYDLTTAGSQQVYAFLNTQSEDTSSYATNNLWKVVDGAWTIHSYDSVTGYTSLAVNRHYSGPDQPHLSTVNLVPFTSDEAEFDALRAGSIDYGYVPLQDLGQQSYLSAHGLRLVPWQTWGIGLMVDNFANPKSGMMIKQLYIRQAIQELINQPQLVRDVLHGYGYPTYGPAPIEPANPYVTSVEKHNPYPYSVSTATHLLAAHGWAIHRDGTDTCERPGTGSGDCGAGITKGEPLAFDLLYASGLAAGNQMMEAIKSSESGGGIDITLQSAPFNTVVTVANPCTSTSPSSYCHWDLADWSPAGGGWFYNGTPFPTGEILMGCGSFLNSGSYCSSTADRLIQATHVQSGLAAYHQYEAYLVKQLPDIWQPQAPYQLSEIRDTLKGATPQDPVGLIDLASWYFKK